MDTKIPSPVEERHALPDKRRAVPLLCNKASRGGEGKEIIGRNMAQTSDNRAKIHYRLSQSEESLWDK